MSGNGTAPDAATAAARRREFRRYLRSRHPHFLVAVLADTRAVSAHRGRCLAEASRGRVLLEAARLCWESDAFFAQILYRAKARLQGLGVPILPRVLHRLSISLSQLYIGDPVVIEAGVHLAHGQMVIDGITEIGSGTYVSPFTSIGLTAGSLFGPRIGRDVMVGTGARMLGHFEVGDRAVITANAVVLEDVPAEATVAGVPAKVVGTRAGG